MQRSHSQDILTVLASLRSADYAYSHQTDSQRARPRPQPFVTISRQAGAGGRSFARGLAARLNELDPGGLPWTVWDNELVERWRTNVRRGLRRRSSA
jgi:hypothetical protein